MPRRSTTPTSPTPVSTSALPEFLLTQPMGQLIENTFSTPFSGRKLQELRQKGGDADGPGPAYFRSGNNVLYPVLETLDWFRNRLGKPARSTSEESARGQIVPGQHRTRRASPAPGETAKAGRGAPVKAASTGPLPDTS
jgi:hypothetical protein